MGTFLLEGRTRLQGLGTFRQEDRTLPQDLRAFGQEGSSPFVMKGERCRQQISTL